MYPPPSLFLSPAADMAQYKTIEIINVRTTAVNVLYGKNTPGANTVLQPKTYVTSDDALNVSVGNESFFLDKKHSLVITDGGIFQVTSAGTIVPA
ncbi:hypothetical protein SKAU_G00377670 [Synaphobranchus kaupii]|uniref:Uncharacterized protein n=1 Tax=Synaphobranchus kaupii TaxID=118154 RepID=A0A9Q1ED11_SYNKA|nr:hypothetical protein SKAU_G00377670 [Synaphobranchus kaupii]